MGRRRPVAWMTRFGAAALLAAAFAAPAIGEATQPEVTITSGPMDENPTKDPTPTFRFKSSVEGSTFTCGFDGPEHACSPPVTAPKLSDGRHFFTVMAIAPDGSQSEDLASSFTVDTRAPVVKIEGPRTIETTKPTARASFKLTGGRWVGFSCRLDESTPEGCRPHYTTPELGPGDHELRASVFDEAGNRGTNVATFRIIRIGK